MTLRPAREEDAWLFFQLRNDPQTIKYSNRGEITREQHAQWWLTTTETRLVAEMHGKPVGVLRIARGGWVSIIVCPGERGKGIGTRMLEQLKSQGEYWGYRVLRAEVLPENAASHGAFMAAGWRPRVYQVEVGG